MKLIVSVFIISAVLNAFAHVDSDLVLTNEGKVTRFDKKFGEIRFEVQKWIPDSKLPKDSIRFAVGKESIFLPDCISKLINKMPRDKVDFGGSWYHSSESLPPYINVSYMDKGSYNAILFSVKPVGFMYLRTQSKVVNRVSRTGMLKIEDLCSKAEIEKMKVAK